MSNHDYRALEANDLSHLSDEEFNALCPQGYHAPGPAPLSPAAERLAIRDAVLAAYADQQRLATLMPMLECLQHITRSTPPSSPSPTNWREND